MLLLLASLSPYIFLFLFFSLASGEKCKTMVMKNGCQNITAERHCFLENIKGQGENVREIEIKKRDFVVFHTFLSPQFMCVWLAA